MSSINLLAWIIKSMPYILNVGIIASYMILLVMIIRALFKQAPKNLICGMWGIAAFRLIVPVSMLESWFSLVPSAKTIQTESLSSQGKVLMEPAVVDVFKNPIYPDAVSLKLPTTLNSFIDGIQIFAVIWFVGVIAMLIYAVASTMNLKEKIRTATLLEPGTKQTEMIDTPFLLGIFKPTIYLPYSINENDLEYVIAHEKAHIKRADHIWKLIGFIILSVYWFNPLFWVAYILFCRDIETACDEAVIKDIEDENKSLYATALLNCSIKRHAFSVCPVAFGEVSVKNRIKHVMNYKKPAVRVLVIAYTICVVLAAGFLTDPKVIADSTEVVDYFWPYINIQSSNKKDTYVHGNFKFPCDSRIVEEVYDLTVGNESYRTQLNFIGNQGDPVYSVIRGRVTFAGFEQGYGNKITIQGWSYDLGTVYFFLDDVYVKEGDTVDYGDIIGTIGKSGFTTNSKLGFRLIKNFHLADPMMIFRDNLDKLTVVK
ncbi:MAG: M23/M56 family metallopeptidase [Clostridia bacterium]|nr:M23/M56 family metallopeptidase [Clostridia bacterium]